MRSSRIFRWRVRRTACSGRVFRDEGEAAMRPDNSLAFALRPRLEVTVVMNAHGKTLSSQRKARIEVLAEFFAVVLAFFGDFGFEKAADAAGFGFDFFGRKNEPICWWVICWRGRVPQHFVHAVEGDSSVESGLAGGCASGFQVFEGLCRVRQDSVEALFVHAEVDEGLGVPA